MFPRRWIYVILVSVIYSSAAYAESSSLPPSIGMTGGGVSGKALNPDISVDGLFAFSQFNNGNPVVFDGGHDPKLNGFNLQQVEMTFGANIDPYLRGDANIVLNSAGGIEVEEAYGTTLDFPGNIQLKGGQFFTPFGRINPTHPHTWDFADMPLIIGRFFGGDGLRGLGAQVSWLTPLPWYSEVIGSVQNSTGPTVLSFRPDTISPVTLAPTNAMPMRTLADALYLLRWNNFFSLSDLFSMNVGATALTGPNFAGQTRIYGGDFYLKYRQPDSLSFIYLQIEALTRLYDSVGSGTSVDSGMYAQVDYRLDAPWERWHVGFRYDWCGPRGAGTPQATTAGGPDIDTGSRWRVSPVITFYPSEFSKLRLQYEYDSPSTLQVAQQVAILQMEFLMGAHGAHKF